jgi:cell division septum initiation protein DivIVA
MISPLIRSAKQWYYQPEIDALLDLVEQKVNYLIDNKKEFNRNRRASLQDIKEYFERLNRYSDEYMSLIEKALKYEMSMAQQDRTTKLMFVMDQEFNKHVND